jgi:hypothetical protein
MPRVLTCTEGNTEAFDIGENVEVRRSPQAMACKKRCAVELGKPQMLQDNWLRGDETKRIENKRTKTLVGGMLDNTQRGSIC